MEKHALRLLALALAAAWGGSETGLKERGDERRMNAGGAEVAWDCVPDYSWGYWKWAWQPCAWLDPQHVQHAIAALEPEAAGEALQ